MAKRRNISNATPVSVTKKQNWNPVTDRGSVYTGTVPNGTVPKQVRIGIAFIRELMEPFQTELLAVPKRVRLESRQWEIICRL